jgi:hypothetical protein
MQAYLIVGNCYIAIIFEMENVFTTRCVNLPCMQTCSVSYPSISFIYIILFVSSHNPTGFTTLTLESSRLSFLNISKHS